MAFILMIPWRKHAQRRPSRLRSPGAIATAMKKGAIFVLAFSEPFAPPVFADLAAFPAALVALSHARAHAEALSSSIGRRNSLGRQGNVMIEMVIDICEIYSLIPVSSKTKKSSRCRCTCNSKIEIEVEVKIKVEVKSSFQKI